MIKMQAVPRETLKRIIALKEAEDPLALERLAEIATLPGVFSVVGLGDLHQSNQETPCSVAVASEKVIYPQLSSNVLNCGMTLIKTDLDPSELSAEFMTMFGRRLSHAAFLDSYRLTSQEIHQVLHSGVEPLLKKYDLPPGNLDNIENQGNAFTLNVMQERLDMSEVLPRLLLNSRNLGPFLPTFTSNHFLEFQVVRDVTDKTTAAAWGLNEGQVVILVHGDYPFTCRLNWHYVPRLRMQDAGVLKKLFYFTSKAQFHLLNSRGLRFFKNRIDLYFKEREFTPLAADSLEGMRYISSLNMAMNFAYAFRFLLYLYIRDCICSILKTGKKVELVWDVAHDSIQKEERISQDCWVARKGAVRSVPNKPVIIAGSYNVDSFVGMALDNPEAQELLYSYDHGCSSIIDYLIKNDKVTPWPGCTTQYQAATGHRVKEEPHIEPASIKMLVKSLTTRHVVKPVAWLRPIANFKV